MFYAGLLLIEKMFSEFVDASLVDPYSVRLGLCRWPCVKMSDEALSVPVS
jgi:hypothetical protein